MSHGTYHVSHITCRFLLLGGEDSWCGFVIKGATPSSFHIQIYLYIHFQIYLPIYLTLYK